MKQITIIICCLLLQTLPSAAQKKAIGQDKELGGVVIKQKELQTANHKARSQNVHFTFIPKNLTNRIYDSLYYVTKFPAPDTAAIMLSSVELTLASYDTSVMDILFLVYQEHAGDTLVYTQKVDIGDLGRHHKVRLYLDQPVLLQPQPYMLGYSFRLKHFSGDYDYRLRIPFDNDRECGRLWLRSSGVTYTQELGRVFPFRIFYYKP